MPDDNSSDRNIFVRFKQHVDNRVSAGLQSVLGLPSAVVSRSFGTGPTLPETAPTAPKDTGNDHFPAPMAEGDAWSRRSREDVEPRVNHLQLAEHSKDSIDNIIDSFRGSSQEESDMGWMLFLTRSPYSPLLLDRHLGWKPSAQGGDLHSQGGDDSPFGGWSDAFDDLLRASSGLPMKDPVLARAQKEASKLQFLLFGASFKNEIAKQAETYLWHLKQSRLDEVLFPYHDRMLSYRSPRTMAEWIAQREAESDTFAQLHGWVEALRKGEELWRKEVVPKIDRIREAVMEEPENNETEEDAYRAVDRQAATKKEILPKKWDDLFDFFKQLGDDEDKPQEVRAISSSERTKPTWSGGTKTVTKKEYVDENGAHHTETVVSVKNADGEETSRGISHSVRSDGTTPNETHQERTKSAPRLQNAEGVDVKDMVPVEDNKKPSGWFWSRK
jgi:hypothetical protein